jgi:23S rRNA (adenine2503-C2)-methyltransferase
MPALKLAKKDLRGLPLEELTAHLSELGEPAYRARQLYTWIHRRGARSFADMSDLPKALRQKLEESCQLGSLEKDLEQRSTDGTIKYRWKTADGQFIESVYMPSEDRKTLCVSTQVGCAMGCAFCMTATLGLKRQLTPGEICDQVYAVNGELRRAGESIDRPLTNLVFMGMGEPLHNFENLKTALGLLQSTDGCNFSHRHITVSTVGLVPMIERFGQETEVKLAISLNATTDEQRSKMMPVNKKWPIAALMEACKKFPMRQGRRITFEYVLLRGVNDSDEDAERLAALMEGVPAKVNLIPYNDNPGLGFHSVDEPRAEHFRELLAKKHVFAAIRKNRGRDIAAACGQLANTEKQAEPASKATLPVLPD